MFVGKSRMLALLTATLIAIAPAQAQSPVFQNLTVTGTTALNAATGVTLGTGDASTGLATMQAVQAVAASVAQGLHVLPPVVVVAVANVTVSNPGTAVFDGATLTSGQRLALVGQSTASQNGLWQFNGSGSALTRTADSIVASTYFLASSGTTYQGSGWYLTTTGTIVVGTTALTFVQFSAPVIITAGTGLTKTGTVMSADLAVLAPVSSITLSAGKLFGNPSTSSAVGSGVTVGSVLSGGLRLRSDGVAIGTPPTTYHLTLVPDVSGISGYYTAARVPSLVTGGTVTATLTGTSAVVVGNFITPPLDPGAIAMPAGFYQHLIYASVDDPAAVVTVTVQAFKRSIDNSSAAATGAAVSSSFSNTSAAGIVVDGSKPTATVMAPNDRLVYRISATRVSGPASITFTLHSNTSVERPTVSSNITGTGQAGPDYQLNVVDLGARADLVTGADGVIAAGGTTLASATVICTGADVTTPAKRFEMNGVGATITGAPLITTITGCSGNSFVLADAATLASGRSFLNSVGGNSIDNSAIVGNYAIGDQLPFVGGDITGGSVTTVQVATLNVAGTVAVVSAGSGGTDGVYKFVGTTGTGNRIEVRGTVVSGALASVALYGNSTYITAPTNTADPITDPTGVNPLAGATISYQLGIDRITIAARGNYLTVPASPIATSAGSISGATGATISPQWVTTNTFSIGTDDTAAFALAITSGLDKMNSAGRFSRRIIRVPAGNYLINGSELPLITRPLLFVGDGVGQSNLYAGASYAGRHVLGYSDLFGSGTNAQSNGFAYQIGQLDWGAGASGLSFFGNLSAASIPDAIVLYGRNTDMRFASLGCNTIGICISSGRITGTQTIAYLRESTIYNIRTRGAGRAGRGVIDIDSIGSSAANEISVVDANIIFPRGNGIRLVNHTSGSSETKNSRWYDTRIEGQGGDPNGTEAPLIQIGGLDDTGAVSSSNFIRTWLVAVPAGAAAIRFTGVADATIPHDISFSTLDIGGPSLGYGIDIAAGYNLEFDVGRHNTADSFLRVAPSHASVRPNKLLGAGSTTTAIKLDSGASATTGTYVGNAIVVPTTASFTGAFSGTTMTVSGSPTGTVAVGQAISGTSIPYGYTITAFGSGTGGTGTYTISNGSGGTLSLSARSVAASLTESRLITAYDGPTKIATVAALQGSAAGFSVAPATGAAYSIDKLVNDYLFFNGFGTESGWTKSVGTGSDSYITTLPFMKGSLTAGALRTLAQSVGLGSSTSIPAHAGTAQMTAPALTSCGTSPAIVGTDTAGEVTMGSGGPTGCVITFNRPYTGTPFCVVTWMANPLAAQSYANDNAAITLTQTPTSGNKVRYLCMARAGG